MFVKMQEIIVSRTMSAHLGIGAFLVDVMAAFRTMIATTTFLCVWIIDVVDALVTMTANRHKCVLNTNVWTALLVEIVHHKRNASKENVSKRAEVVLAMMIAMREHTNVSLECV